MNTVWKPLYFLAVIPLGLSYCGPADEPATAEVVAAAAKSNNAFCFSLLAQPDETKGNLIFSPFSVWSALSMTSAGAEADTLRQMQQVLFVPAGGAHHGAAGWLRHLKTAQGVEMTVANRLWGLKGLPFRAEFLKVTKRQYDAGLEPLDFATDPEGSREQINRWVAENTANRIKDLLAPGTIPQETRLVLTNAVYFNGKWMEPFSIHATQKREFRLATGTTIQPETMSDMFAVGYMENERLKAVRLRYEGGQMAMVVVLPKQADALVQSSFLDADGFAGVLSAMKEEKKVVVQMPKFEASTRLQLSETLKAMGMERAFGPDAQFGLMCESPVRISEVIHQAWVKVEEKGTEAAAATAVMPRPTSAMPRDEAPPKMFIADHPFLFFIVDERNDGIVFAGRVMDPTR
jgi:serpin B